jgi:hypothetical protein
MIWQARHFFLCTYRFSYDPDPIDYRFQRRSSPEASAADMPRPGNPMLSQPNLNIIVEGWSGPDAIIEMITMVYDGCTQSPSGLYDVQCPLC